MRTCLRYQLWAISIPLLFTALAMPVRASAHLVTTGMGPVYDGIGHLLLTPEDLVPLLALAMFCGMRGPLAGRCLLFSLPLFWFLGGLAGLRGDITLDLPVHALSFLLLGLLIAADLKLTASALTAIAAGFGLVHGFLNGSRHASHQFSARPHLAEDVRHCPAKLPRGNNRWIDGSAGLGVSQARVKEHFGHGQDRKESPEDRTLVASTESIIELVCTYFKITRAQLMVSRRSCQNLPRDLAIFLVRQNTGSTLSEAGKHFNISTYSTVRAHLDSLLQQGNKSQKQT